MSHSFACQNTSGHDGGRPASTPWTYVSEPSRTAGTTHAAAMINQSRPIFTRRRYLPGESWGDAGSEWLYRCSRRSKASARINADGKQPRTYADRQSACRQLDSVPGSRLCKKGSATGHPIAGSAQRAAGHVQKRERAPVPVGR